MKDTDLFEIDDSNHYLGPMFKRFWCANDPTLMFAGLTHGSTYQFFLEKCLIITKHYILNEFTMPSREEMLQDIEETEKLAPEDKGAYYSVGKCEFDFMENLYEFYKEKLGDKALPYNTKFNLTLMKFMGTLVNDLRNGNWHDFKHPDMSGYDVLDTSDYF